MLIPHVVALSLLVAVAAAVGFLIRVVYRMRDRLDALETRTDDRETVVNIMSEATGHDWHPEGAQHGHHLRVVPDPKVLVALMATVGRALNRAAHTHPHPLVSTGLVLVGLVCVTMGTPRQTVAPTTDAALPPPRTLTSWEPRPPKPYPPETAPATPEPTASSTRATDDEAPPRDRPPTHEPKPEPVSNGTGRTAEHDRPDAQRRPAPRPTPTTPSPTPTTQQPEGDQPCTLKVQARKLTRARVCLHGAT